MKLRFLGTGAADWNGRDERGELRRLTSTLINGHILIDFTMSDLDMLPDPTAVTDILYTHSHDDHFDPKALALLAPCRAYMHESWAGEVQVPGVEVIPLKVGKPVVIGECTFTPMPANHLSERPYETVLHYMIESEGKRIIYCTDGGWMLQRASEIIGKHVLDAYVTEATIGDIAPGDFRAYGHTSIDMIRLLLKTMHNTGRLPKNAPVYLTHMARTLHPTQKDLERMLEPPFIACYDGFETEI